MADSGNTDLYILVHKLLFQIAVGNRPDIVTDLEDKTFRSIMIGLENIVSELMMWEQLHNINPNLLPQTKLYMAFVLDENFKIVGHNSEAGIWLDNGESKNLKLPFEKIIALSSSSTWERLKLKMALEENSAIENLTLQSPKGIMVVSVTLSKLTGNTNYLITILRQEIESKHMNAIKVLSASSDELINNLHRYITDNLDTPLPTLKSLAERFGTEEHKLKIGFKEKYNSSVYSYFHKLRLQKAHDLIENSNTPLKQIAFNTGFNTYLNFYKAFKKEFGYAPSKIFRGDG